MAKTRDNYSVIGNTADEIRRSMNFLLQRMADRMDKIEGIRGTASIESDLDMNANRVTDIAGASASTDALNKAQADLTGSSPTFTSIVTTSVLVKDTNGTTIHSME